LKPTSEDGDGGGDDTKAEESTSTSTPDATIPLLLNDPVPSFTGQRKYKKAVGSAGCHFPFPSTLTYNIIALLFFL
jgi:hypothetical protein